MADACPPAPAAPPPAAAAPPPWTPSSWRSKPIKQQPRYPDEGRLAAAVAEVAQLPPLVTPQEVDRLREQLAEVAEGRRFLIQGGDCAERFLDCAAEPIEQKLRILLQMSLVLTWGARVPTVRIARMAGQFAKPRSRDTETVDGVEYTAFRGDNVNSFDTSSRDPDPGRLVQGYFHSAATLNYARALLSTGLGDLHNASHWDLGFVQDCEHRQRYKGMVDSILSSLDFMRVCGVGGGPEAANLRTADVFMSHEGLQLCYEEALTRPVHAATVVGPGGLVPGLHRVARDGFSSDAPATPVAPPAALHLRGRARSRQPTTPSPLSAVPPEPPAATAADATTYFNLGTHFLWIGDRTRQLDHAHIEYFRGIANPIGIKVGPSSDPAELVQLLRVLWPQPQAQRGKIAIITRLGAGAVRGALPAIIRAVQGAHLGAPVVWTCDPMHGNTRVTSTGIKTRDFDDILAELRETFEVHRELGSRLGGCHVELTGENVTECTGGPEKLLEHDLPRRYTTYCDPRLNYGQGLELSLLMAQYLAEERTANLAATSGVPAESFIGSDGPAFGSVDVGTAPQQLELRGGGGGSDGGPASVVAAGTFFAPAAAPLPPVVGGALPLQLPTGAAAGGSSLAAASLGYVGNCNAPAASDGDGAGLHSARSGRPRFAAGRGERPRPDAT